MAQLPPFDPNSDPSSAARASERRLAYLRFPGETPEVDYKAAMSFRDDDFALGLVRHILGMANAGGGSIVIGYKEDPSGKPSPDPAMTNEIAKTYDASKIAQVVERYVRGTTKLSIRIHKEHFEERTFPVIEVDGFERAHPSFAIATRRTQLGSKC